MRSRLEPANGNSPGTKSWVGLSPMFSPATAGWLDLGSLCVQYAPCSHHSSRANINRLVMTLLPSLKGAAMMNILKKNWLALFLALVALLAIAGCSKKEESKGPA